MLIRLLTRGGIYVLFIVGVIVGWLLKRRNNVRQTTTHQDDLPLSTNPLEDLHNPKWQVRLSAVQSLATQHQENMLPELVPMLADTDSDVRDAAVTAVSTFGAPAVPFILTILRESSVDGREAAARTLIIIAADSAVSGLIDALGDESAWVRKPVAEALGGIADASSVPALITALENEKDSLVQDSILNALKSIDTPQARTALAKH